MNAIQNNTVVQFAYNLTVTVRKSNLICWNIFTGMGKYHSDLKMNCWDMQEGERKGFGAGCRCIRRV